jgi:hypothetical protein
MQTNTEVVETQMQTVKVVVHPSSARGGTGCEDTVCPSGVPVSMPNDLVSETQVQIVEASKKLTAIQEVKIAELIAGDWEMVVSYLEPDHFQLNKISEIKERERSPFLRAQTALIMWRERFNGDATRYKLIKALCEAGFRSQAVAVFKDELVKFVVPL